jgi:hypothetical protein
MRYIRKRTDHIFAVVFTSIADIVVVVFIGLLPFDFAQDGAIGDELVVNDVPAGDKEEQGSERLKQSGANNGSFSVLKTDKSRMNLASEVR